MSAWTRLLAAAGLAALLAGCVDGTAQDAAAPEPAAPPTVALARAATEPSLAERRFVGRIEALSTVDVAFQVGGRLASIPVREGAIVPAGGLLASLDTADYETALREAEVSLELARAEFERRRELLPSGSTSRAAFDQAQAELRLREAGLDTARRNLDRATLEAPAAALVTRRLVDPFAYVQPGDPVLRIQDVSELRVRIAVPEALMRLSLDESAVEVVAVTGAGLAGETRSRLVYREHATEPNAVAQTYDVVFALVDPPPGLLPGMTASVVVAPVAGARAQRLSVPVASVVSDADGAAHVFVFDGENGRVSRRAVTLAGIAGEGVLVAEGLAPGETVVAAGAHLLRDGMAVRPLGAL